MSKPTLVYHEHMQIAVNQLEYSYSDSPGLALCSVSANFPEGWTGIVGSNGSGKSTLLRLVCGDLESGTLRGSIMPKPGRLKGLHSYCAQATEFPPDQAEDFALDYSADAIRIRSLLGIEDEWPWRFSLLSHGERKRLQLAVVLWLNPPVLALDEPTNHVDDHTRGILVAALKAYMGVGLLVSHDRELLDELVQQCLFMREGTAVMRAGDYTTCKAQEQQELASLAHQRQTAKSTLRQAQAEQARRAEAAAQADSKRSKRGINAKDHDAKAKIDLARVSGQDGKAGKRLAQMQSQVSSAKERLAKAYVPKVYEATFWLSAQPAKRRVLAHLPAEKLALGDTGRQLSFPDLYVENTEHIGLEGPNGAGKSTLLRHLLGCIADDLPYLYIPQELTDEQMRGLVNDVRQMPASARGELLSLVARLNSNPDRILAGDALSPGEARKLMLCTGAVNSSQLIIMDEPTNHLDLQSIEAIETMLAAFPGALVLVSHDKHLLDATTQTRWQFLPDGTLGVSTGR